MKSFRLRLCCASLFFAVLALSPLLMPAANAAPVLVQSFLPPMQIEVEPQGGDEKSIGARVVLRFPGSDVLPQGRVRVALYESGKTTKIAEIARRIEARQIAFQVQADPGVYDVRVLADNRARTPLFAPQTMNINGILRENGAWLINGSPFVGGADFFDDGTAPRDAVANASLSAAPLFVAGLRRDFSAKSKSDGQRVIPLGAKLLWRTLRLTFTEQDNEKTVRAALIKALATASTRGERNLLGVEVLVTTNDASLLTDAARTLAALRRAMNGLAPTAALILHAYANSRDIQTRFVAQNAALCDAVVIEFDDVGEPDSAAWAMKAARRIAEEQPRFDLPIFVGYNGFDIPSVLNLWMSGATGIIAGNVENPAPNSLLRVLARNESLFAGGATIEDIGLWPAPEGGDSLALYQVLCDAGRIPLLARPRDASEKDARVLAAESLMTRFGAGVSAATIERLRIAAEAGARLYIEGAPLQDEKGASAPWRLTKLLGFTGKPRENSSQRDTLTLNDAWTFGALRGLQLNAPREIDIQLLPPTTASQAKSERGRDVLTGPRVLATFSDGTPAIVVNPVGKGLVMWSPGGIGWTKSRDETKFYRAVAAWVSPPQVELRDGDGEAVRGLRVALRRSQSGAVNVLSIYNSQPEPRLVDATVDGAAGIALDLMSEHELPLQTEGYRSTATISIPPRGIALVAFAATRKALEDERNTPRRRAKMK